MDKKISQYIDRQPPLQRKIILTVRKIFYDTLPDCDEAYRWGVIAFSGGKFYLAGMKERVHVGFAIQGLDKKETDLFEGNGKTMRHLKINNLRDIDQKHLAGLIRLVNKKATCTPEIN